MFYSLVIYPLTQIIELVFTFCEKLSHNTGAALLGVSCAVSFLTLPLYVVAEHWQEVERDKQKSMKAEIDKIKSVFHGNERFMILSTYYRQQHYHPIMALRSAFGLLIQIPFFTAAYTCLSHMSALQGHHLLFIRDLGAPDALFTIGSFSVNVLPIVMTLINMVSSTIYTKGFPVRDKLYTYGLALVFVVLLYNSPAGLVLYWTMNNIFSLIKNVFYKMKHPVKVLYVIACVFVSMLIIWILISHRLSAMQAALMIVCFALIYPSPLYIRLANHLIDKTFVALRDSFKARLALFIASALGLTLLIGLLIPSLLISSSPEEFCGIDGIANPVFFIKNTFFQSAGIFLVWCSLVFFLYHERMQTLIVFFLSCLLCVNILDTFVFAGNYGTLSKLLKFTESNNVYSSVGMILLNSASLMALITVVIVLLKFRKQIVLTYILGFASLGLATQFLFNISKINTGYSSYKEKIADGEAASEIKPIFHFSKSGRNVLLLYLDCAQSRFLEPLFEECNELYQEFSGFTFFPNTVSFNAHTLIGSPPVYGGYDYTPEAMNKREDERLVDKTNESLLLLPRVFTEQGKDYSATTTDSCWANYSWIPDLSIFSSYPKIDAHLTDAVYTDLWYKEHQDVANFGVTSKTLRRNILWYSFFRAAPLALRPAFYGDGNYWSTDTESDDYNDYIDGYAVLEYLPRLTDFSAKTENSFISFSNNTTHDGLLLQAPEYKPQPEVTDYGKYGKDRSYHSFAGALRRIGEFFAYLKNNGVYDNTRIVIVADHGSSGDDKSYKLDDKFERIQPQRYHPLLMFKDFNSSGNLKIDNTFMTNADAPALLTQGIIGNARNPFTQNSIGSTEKNNGALVCTDDIFMPHHNRSAYILTAKPDSWWRVKDNIFDSANWTQEIHEIQKNVEGN